MPSFTLDNYKLTLPVDVDGNPSGHAHEIHNPELATFDNAYFNQANDYYEYICEDEGALTPNARYPRTELRHLTNYSQGEASEDALAFSVEEIDEGKNVIVYQIHGSTGGTWLKVLYRGEREVRIKFREQDGGPEQIIYIEQEPINKQRYNIKCEYNGSQLKVFWDGIIVAVLDMSCRTGTYYYKRGAYLQDDDADGTTARVRNY